MGWPLFRVATIQGFCIRIFTNYRTMFVHHTHIPSNILPRIYFSTQYLHLTTNRSLMEGLHKMCLVQSALNLLVTQTWHNVIVDKYLYMTINILIPHTTCCFKRDHLQFITDQKMGVGF